MQCLKKRKFMLIHFSFDIEKRFAKLSLFSREISFMTIHKFDVFEENYYTSLIFQMSKYVSNGLDFFI